MEPAMDQVSESVRRFGRGPYGIIKDAMALAGHATGTSSGWDWPTQARVCAYLEWRTGEGWLKESDVSPRYDAAVRALVRESVALWKTTGTNGPAFRRFEVPA
jgi:hypothetical protein